MDALRNTNPNLDGVVPYDPKYLPAEAMLSANENPEGLPPGVAGVVSAAIARVQMNRYPDPLANDLRDEIAAAYGLSRENVLVGNGGDELLFNIAFAWGGPGRTMLDLPPTFSVYAANARLCGTNVVNVQREIGDSSAARDEDLSPNPQLEAFLDYKTSIGKGREKCVYRFGDPESPNANQAPKTREPEAATYCRIDEAAVLDKVARGDIDYLTVCSPNNPTGEVASQDFMDRLLGATDALVLADEAYGEFAGEGETALPLLQAHKNLAILHTFSKAYGIAGVRVGYLLADPQVIAELQKVRQPYSVDALSQAVALEVFKARDDFAKRTARMVEERERMLSVLESYSEVDVWPSKANYLFMRVPKAAYVWERLYGRGVLVRDFSAGDLTRDCLRVSIGTPEQNDLFLNVLGHILDQEREYLE